MEYRHHNFRANLKRLRLGRGWTQGQLAHSLSVTVSTVQNWEQGRTQPSLDQLGYIAGELGCFPADLVNNAPC